MLSSLFSLFTGRPSRRVVETVAPATHFSDSMGGLMFASLEVCWTALPGGYANWVDPAGQPWYLCVTQLS